MSALADLVGIAFDVALEVGTKSKAGCAFALVFIALLLVFGGLIYYAEATSCETRCLSYGEATTIGGECVCRTEQGTYIDPQHPPTGAP